MREKKRRRKRRKRREDQVEERVVKVGKGGEHTRIGNVGEGRGVIGQR